jgi:TetR/AcrR family transcriptional repressor of mexJK operon
LINKDSTARRPGRPKSEQKAEAIREAASHLFMTEGMERTSMDAIAQAAGVSKQTVYSHFHSKDELFRDCVRCKVAEYGLQVSEIDRAVSVDDKLRHVGRNFLTLLSDVEVIKMFRLMIAESATFPRVSRSFHESGPLATIEFMTTIFASHLPADEPAVARRAAGEFASLLKGEFLLGMLLGTRSGISQEEISAHVEHTVRQMRRLYPLSERAIR